MRDTQPRRNPYYRPNPYDQRASDFFHSVTFKIMITIFGSVVGGSCLLVIVLTILSLLGVGGAIVGIWQMFIKPVANYLEPSNPPLFQTTPQRLPTVMIIAPDLNNSDWRWESIDLYNFWIELPKGWYLHEQNRVSDTLCGLGHDLAEYVIDGDNGDVVSIKFLCGPRGGEGLCPAGIQIIDPVRSIYEALDNTNEVFYYGWDNDGSCGDGWPVGAVNMAAEYKNAGENYDLEYVHRILLSVKPK